MILDFIYVFFLFIFIWFIRWISRTFNLVDLPYLTDSIFLFALFKRMLFWWTIIIALTLIHFLIFSKFLSFSFFTIFRFDYNLPLIFIYLKLVLNPMHLAWWLTVRIHYKLFQSFFIFHFNILFRNQICLFIFIVV